jgi:hypothetical protein
MILRQIVRTTISETYIGINELKKGYQPRTSIGKDESGNLFADSHGILSRWKNFFYQLLNVHGISDVRQTEMHTVHPFVHEPRFLEVEIALQKLKRYKSLDTDQIPAELIQARGN